MSHYWGSVIVKRDSNVSQRSVAHRYADDKGADRSEKPDGSGHAANRSLVGALVHGGCKTSDDDQQHLDSERHVVPGRDFAEIDGNYVPDARHDDEHKCWPRHPTKSGCCLLWGIAAKSAKHGKQPEHKNLAAQPDDDTEEVQGGAEFVCAEADVHRCSQPCRVALGVTISVRIRLRRDFGFALFDWSQPASKHGIEPIEQFTAVVNDAAAFIGNRFAVCGIETVASTMLGSPTVKIRIGYGLGTASSTTDPVRFGSLVDNLETLGFDSLWLSERVNGPALDPVVGMTFAIARTERLKVGASVMVLPGRNPVLLAKTMASLDRLSNGRLLPAFGLGIANAAEHQAFGVQRNERSAWFNEAMPLLRRLWSEDSVAHSGERFTLNDARVNPKPVQDPLEVWMGGAAPLELRRVGRYSDGWLPSFCTASDVEAGIATINAHATDIGRIIDPEHFGVLLGYTDGELPDRLVQFAKQRHPDRDPRDVVATRDSIVERLQAFVEVGASKFVIVPIEEPTDWTRELNDMAELVLPLEN